MNEKNSDRLLFALEPRDWDLARHGRLVVDQSDDLWFAYDNDGDLISSCEAMEAQRADTCHLLTDDGRHQLAALALHNQEFGFSERDVLDELFAARLLERYANELERSSDESIGAATPRALAARARFRAARIAALLPSSDVTRGALLPARTVAQWTKDVPGDRTDFWALGVPGF